MNQMNRINQMPSSDRAHRAARLREAVEARDALASALTRAGIQLPAMDVRTPWLDACPGGGTSDGEVPGGEVPDGPSSARYALVHLGVCSAPVALALAAVIAKGSSR